jgi:hypothetical protein
LSTGSLEKIEKWVVMRNQSEANRLISLASATSADLGDDSRDHALAAAAMISSSLALPRENRLRGPGNHEFTNRSASTPISRNA